MDGVTAFIDAIYDCYHKLVRNIEEDQELPSKEILEEVCQVLLNVSCMREEGRFPTFRVCFVRPDSELLDTYIYAHVLLFKSPIAFGTRELHKLAPALNPDMSYLMLDISKKPYTAVGIIAAYTSWEKIMTREISSGNRMPRIPNILVKGPGELRACFGEASIVNYNSGHCVFFRTNTFTSTLIAEQLADGATVSEIDRMRLLYRLLWHVSSYHHGGAVLIVPSAESCEEFVDLKYQLASRFMFNNRHKLDYISSMAREKEIITYADLIAKLTSVDGSVVLTKDLDLLGFGAETLTDKMADTVPSMCFVNHDDTVNTSKHFKDYGMRHRAGYRFVNAVKGSVAFIVSQDGVIEACTWHEGKVVVYDNIALPLL